MCGCEYEWEREREREREKKRIQKNGVFVLIVDLVIKL
jgi:hypothetical protein